MILKVFIGHLVASILTIPFLNQLWLGELPLLAVIQLPKVTLANWLRTDVVMKGIKIVGLSKGSFSPDYIMARPYALLIAYLIVLGIVFGLYGLRTRMGKSTEWPH